MRRTDPVSLPTVGRRTCHRVRYPVADPIPEPTGVGVIIGE